MSAKDVSVQISQWVQVLFTRFCQ